MSKECNYFLSNRFLACNGNICKKCLKLFPTIEEHHLWPKFMDNPHGYTFKTYFSRVILCNDCHKKLHKEIIMPIVRKYSLMPKYQSEDYLWKYVPLLEKSKCIEEAVQATIKYANISS